MSEKLQQSSEKTKEESKASEKPSKQEVLTWKNSTVLEKIGLVGSFVFLIAAVVFLVFEFKYDLETWPYASFDLAISLAFFCEALSNWKRKRSLAIITLITGAIFLVLGILKFLGIF